MNPVNYKLRLAPNLKNFTFSGTTEIHFVTVEPIETIYLNALELTIHQCSIRKNNTFVSCPFQLDGDNESLEISLPGVTSGTLQLKIDYTGQINDKLAGFYRSSYGPEEARNYIAVTQFEESDARRAFPCLDHPRHKATFDIEIVSDENLVAISNAPVKKLASYSEGKTGVRFQQTPKMSTYLVFFGVGDFNVTEDTTDSRVRIVTIPGRENYRRYGLEFGTKALRFCEDYFNIPYPLPKLDLIAVPDFAFGAMENWGAITFRENLLLYYPGITSRAGEERICEVIAHEIVHQWFGNLVTPSDWRYLWLNESFATYFGFGVVAHYHPEWDTWDQFLDSMTDTALERDSLNKTFSVEIPSGEHVVINTATAPIIYNKGGSILRQVEGYIGAENFKEGLRDYLNKHSYGCAASHHLWEAFERVSEKPIVEMMKGWIENPGLPLLQVKRDGGNLVITQKRFTYLPNESDHTWLIPISVRTIDDSGNCKTFTTLLENKTTLVHIGSDTVAYKVNDGQTGFYRTKYLDRGNLDALGKLILQKKLSATNRWGIENDLFALVRSGDMSIGNYFEFLANYQNEAAFLPLSSIADNLFHAYLIFEGDLKQQAASIGKSLLEGVLDNIGYEPNPAEGHTLTVLRDRIIWHALVYGSREAQTFAQKQVNKLLGNQRLHPDIQKSIMQAGALLEGKKAYGWLEKRFQISESEHESMNLLMAIGCFTEKEVVKKALRFALDNVPPRNKFIPIMSASGNPYAIPFMWDWYLAHKEKLETFHPLLYERVIAAIIPICGLKDPNAVEAFFTDYIKEHAELKDTIQMSLERLAINVHLKNNG